MGRGLGVEMWMSDTQSELISHLQASVPNLTNCSNLPTPSAILTSLGSGDDKICQNMPKKPSRIRLLVVVELSMVRKFLHFGFILRLEAIPT